MLKDAEDIESSALTDKARELQAGGWRLVGITPLPLEEGVELLYHFDRDLRWRHLRLRTSGTAPLPSLSRIYPGAFLPENEAQDQLGLTFEGLSPNYRSTFFLEDEADPSPVCRGVSVRVERKDGKETCA